MPNRFYYYVSPAPNGGWNAHGHGQQPVNFETKEKALAAAVNAAHQCWQGGQHSGVRVQLANGQWQEERTYGADPYPPKG